MYCLPVKKRYYKAPFTREHFIKGPLLKCRKVVKFYKNVPRVKRTTIFVQGRHFRSSIRRPGLLKQFIYYY